MEDMRPYDPAYLPGSHSPQLTCFPLANFFEILYNRIDMTGGLAAQASSDPSTR